jgi:diacylglycerol O-acyltransferase / wax synthase
MSAHLDRLSAVDASFLLQEGASTHMHIGGVATFDGPAPTYDEFLEHIGSRLGLVPRYRQKIAEPPLRTGLPLWVDDPSFNLGYHVRQTALPHPGGEEQLLALTSRIFSQRLDRTKPLWEMWLVEGYEKDRFALVSKTHHCLVDGISGVDLMSVLFDLSPVPREIEEEEWLPAVEPSGAQLLAESLKSWVDTGRALAGGAIDALRRPGTAVDRLREAVTGVGEVAWAGINPPPPTPLTGEIGTHRRFAVVRERLDDLKEIKNTFGGTVNDVVLAVVSGALKDWLRSRGVRTEGLELRALVPVSIRGSEQHGQLGNQLAVMRGPLPVYVEDPIARLRVVKAAMDGLKESKQAVGAEVLTSMQNFAPPTILAQASRLNFSTRLFNLLVTNVPGPQFPLYILGRELLDLFPVAFLPQKHALAIAIMSYNGGIDFGLLGDYDAMGDIDVVGERIEASLDELVKAAKARSKPKRAPRKKAAPAAS